MFLACFLTIDCHRLENTFLVVTRLKRQTIKGSIGESQGNGMESLKVVCKPVLQPWNLTSSLLQTILSVSNTQYSTLWLTKPWKASLLILLTIIFPWKDISISSETILMWSSFTSSKGWVATAKLKKIQEGLVRFGCNLGQLIAYLCRL